MTLVNIDKDCKPKADTFYQEAKDSIFLLDVDHTRVRQTLNEEVWKEEQKLIYVVGGEAHKPVAFQGW